MSHRLAISRTHAALAACTASLVLLAGLPGTALAEGAHSRARPTTVTLTSHFKRFASGQLMGYDNRVLAFDTSSGEGVLVNGTTAHRTTLTVSDCPSPVAIGGSSIVFYCGVSADPSRLPYEVYNMDSGGFTAFALPPFSSVVAVGSDWLSLAGQCADTEHCPQSFSLQSLATGADVSDPTNATTTVDLDSADPARSVCAPVRVPTNGQGNPEPPSIAYGSVSSDGQFQIATSSGGSFLERCGAQLRERLTYTSYPGCAHQHCAPPFSSHAIVWQSKPGRLSGVFLPSLKRFAISVPATIDPQAAHEQFVNGNQYSLALTTHTLYLGLLDTVWAMPIPTAPPKPKRSPRSRSQAVPNAARMGSALSARPRSSQPPS